MSSHNSPEAADPLLLTPGPLTTSPGVKQAMLHDFGSRDHRFTDINRHILDRLTDLIGEPTSFVTVPVQGSGTFAVEAMLGTLVPRDGKVLVCVNGAYGRRVVRICEYLHRDCEVMESDEQTPVDIDALDRRLSDDPAISHVVAVHCETTSGILNPIQAIADVVQSHDRSLLIDAMSAFGALPLDSRKVHFDAVAASSNKCLQGVPGLGFCIIRQSVLEQCAGNAHSLSLDLYDQWQAMESTGQWRFTPPTHVLLAFHRALEEFDAEGGVAARGRRYRENCAVLVQGMRELGFRTLLPDELQAPIIVTFHLPTHPAFDFDRFYDRLGELGYVIYPGKLTVADSFRVGCIGDLGSREMASAIGTVQQVLQEMGVSGDLY